MYIASRLAADELAEAAGAVVTQTDLAELERLNRGNIHALEEIVGHHGRTETEHELRRRGPRNALPKVLTGPNFHMGHHGRLWDTVGHPGTPWDTLGHHGTPYTIAMDSACW